MFYAIVILGAIMLVTAFVLSLINSFHKSPGPKGDAGAQGEPGLPGASGVSGNMCQIAFATASSLSLTSGTTAGLVGFGTSTTTTLASPLNVTPNTSSSLAYGFSLPQGGILNGLSFTWIVINSAEDADSGTLTLTIYISQPPASNLFTPTAVFTSGNVPANSPNFTVVNARSTGFSFVAFPGALILPVFTFTSGAGEVLVGYGMSGLALSLS
jgi:hypothetical protein